MKIGTLIRSYGITDFLPAVLACYAHTDKIVVMNFRFKTAQERPDDTKEIVERMRPHLKEIVCESGSDLCQHEILNNGLETLRDCDFCWIADSDEFLTRADQDDILSKMQSITHCGLTLCKVLDYVSDAHHVMNPPREHRAVVVVRPSKICFGRIREPLARGWNIFSSGAFVHNFGYLYDSEKTAWKSDWVKKEEAVSHGIMEQGMKSVIEQQAPAEIVELLRAYKVAA